MTAKNKKSFLLHIDSLVVLDDLTNEQAGELFKAISAYQKNEEFELSPIVKIAFSPFKNQFMRDDDRYEKTCERRAKAGALGGRAKAEKSKQVLANASNCKQNLANVADNKNKNKNKTNNKSDNKKEEIGEVRAKRFAPPTLEEAKSYFEEYAIEKSIFITIEEPQAFIDFYQSKNWYVGKNKMKDWKAAVRNWFKNIKQSTGGRLPLRHDVNEIDHDLPEGYKW